MPFGASLEADEMGEDVALSMPPTSPKWGTDAAPHGTPPTVPEEPMIRPAGRSHSVKGSSGIMRRLTNKGHSIARSFSLHVKENGEGKNTIDHFNRYLQLTVAIVHRGKKACDSPFPSLTPITVVYSPIGVFVWGTVSDYNTVDCLFLSILSDR